MESIYLRAIKWRENFVKTKGSYYDYVASIFSTNKGHHTIICNELTVLGWENVPTNTDITVYLKDRHVIRIYKFY